MREIKRNIYSLDTPDTDVAIVEIGGTVGDIESQPFLESIRQIAAERGRHNVMFLHVSLIVSIPGTGELKRVNVPLDLIGDVVDDLDRGSQIVPGPLPVEHVPVDLPRGDGGVDGEVFVDKALIVAQV